MEYEYVKSKPIRLRDTGRDEKWLQDVISKDTAILGLGDIVVIQRERQQPAGGRIDLIMADPEENLRYEVEIMLGTIDESHIIRTIEYWEAKGSKNSLDLMDAVVALIPEETPDVRIKYNREHVALGTSGTNFCWFHP